VKPHLFAPADAHVLARVGRVRAYTRGRLTNSYRSSRAYTREGESRIGGPRARVPNSNLERNNMKFKAYLVAAILGLVFIGTALAGSSSAIMNCARGHGGMAVFSIQANSTSEGHGIYYNYLTGGRWVTTLGGTPCGPVPGGCWVYAQAGSKPYPWNLSAITESSNKPVFLELKQCL